MSQREVENLIKILNRILKNKEKFKKYICLLSANFNIAKLVFLMFLPVPSHFLLTHPQSLAQISTTRLYMAENGETHGKQGRVRRPEKSQQKLLLGPGFGDYATFKHTAANLFILQLVEFSPSVSRGRIQTLESHNFPKT